MLKRWLVAFFDWMARRCARCGMRWADLADSLDPADSVSLHGCPESKGEEAA